MGSSYRTNYRKTAGRFGETDSDENPENDPTSPLGGSPNRRLSRYSSPSSSTSAFLTQQHKTIINTTTTAAANAGRSWDLTISDEYQEVTEPEPTILNRPTIDDDNDEMIPFRKRSEDADDDDKYDVGDVPESSVPTASSKKLPSSSWIVQTAMSKTGWPILALMETATTYDETLDDETMTTSPPLLDQVRVVTSSNEFMSQSQPIGPVEELAEVSTIIAPPTKENDDKTKKRVNTTIISSVRNHHTTKPSSNTIVALSRMTKMTITSMTSSSIQDSREGWSTCDDSSEPYWFSDCLDDDDYDDVYQYNYDYDDLTDDNDGIPTEPMGTLHHHHTEESENPHPQAKETENDECTTTHPGIDYEWVSDNDDDDDDDNDDSNNDDVVGEDENEGSQRSRRSSSPKTLETLMEQPAVEPLPKSSEGRVSSPALPQRRPYYYSQPRLFRHVRDRVGLVRDRVSGSHRTMTTSTRQQFWI